MTATLLGSKELSRKLDRLSKSGSKRAIVAGIRASMTPIARAMRAAIHTSDASPELKREARKTIGARFAKKRYKDVREARVGFSVGKKKAAIGKAMAAREKRIAGGGKGGGVGISAANIHWFVLGTKERATKERHIAAIGMEGGVVIFRPVQKTGKIQGVFGDVTRQALASSAGASLAAARRKIQQVIEREARKKG